MELNRNKHPNRFIVVWTSKDVDINVHRLVTFFLSIVCSPDLNRFLFFERQEEIENKKIKSVFFFSLSLSLSLSLSSLSLSIFHFIFWETSQFSLNKYFREQPTKKSQIMKIIYLLNMNKSEFDLCFLFFYFVFVFFIRIFLKVISKLQFKKLENDKPSVWYILNSDTSSNSRRDWFHLILLGKVWIQLFSLQLWVNSRADLVLRPWWGN